MLTTVGFDLVAQRHRCPAPVRRLGRHVLRAAHLDGLLDLAEHGLRDTGWLLSARLQRPVTKDGDSIPWWTYSATSFVGARLPTSARVWEYGCGNSTLWFAARVAE